LIGLDSGSILVCFCFDIFEDPIIPRVHSLLASIESGCREVELRNSCPCDRSVTHWTWFIATVDLTMRRFSFLREFRFTLMDFIESIDTQILARCPNHCHFCVSGWIKPLNYMIVIPPISNHI
jgi:hypothetical protein